MKVRFKLFATLGDYLPPGSRSNHVDLDVAEGTAVAGLIDQYQLPPKLVHLVLVNGHFIPPEARATHVLVEGDELAIWPPIAGG